MKNFSAFPSDSFQFLSYSYHDTLLFRVMHYLYKLNQKKVSFKQTTIQCTERISKQTRYSSQWICQPSVLPTQSAPSFTGHYKDVNGWTGGEGAFKKNKQPGISRRPFLHRIRSTAHLKLMLTTNYWKDWKSGILPTVPPFFSHH